MPEAVPQRIHTADALTAGRGAGESGVNRARERQIACQGQRGRDRRGRFAQECDHLGPHPRTGQLIDQSGCNRLAGRFFRAPLEREPEAGGIAHRANEPGGIVAERGRMQHPDQAGLQIGAAAEGIQHLPKRGPGQHRRRAR